MAEEVANDCKCLSWLDELRLKHEEGKVDSFVVVVVEGDKTWTFGHKPDYLGAMSSIIDSLQKQVEERNAG